MRRNVGKVDAWIRGILAVLLFAAGAVFNRLPAVSLIAALAALILVGTALTRNCPLYRGLGLDTSQRQSGLTH